MRHRTTIRRLALGATGTLLLAATACGGGGGGDAASCEVGEVDGDLFLYNWSEYIDPELKDAFSAEYGVNISEDNYDSNEAMQLIVAAGGSGYDVIVPSDYMVSIMIEQGSLMKLNRDAIPNMVNLAPEFNPPPYDPNGEYAAAYQGGTTGLGVDLTVLGEDTPFSWSLIFDPEISANYAGRITLLDDPRETLGAALKYLGYSLNTTDEAQLAEAEALVADSVQRIAAFDSSQYDELLATGQTAIAHGFSGNMVVGIQDAENPDNYVYFVPEEGGTIWTDNMAIPFDAPHPCTAHTFINFILDAENGAQLSEWNFYASPNLAAREVMDPEVAAILATMYPADLSGLEYITDTGDFETNFSDALSRAKG